METRIACLIALLFSFGCSGTDRSGATGNPEKQEHASVTLGNLGYVDMYSTDYTTEHPLLCGAGRDFPLGREIIFRPSESGKPVHAVFPDGETAPENVDGSFVLHGRYQGIQKRDYPKHKLHKRPPSDYRYFVVATWERLPSSVSSDTWPQFRGPAGSGIGSGNPPTKWDIENQTNVRFNVSIPGLAHSSPIVWHDRVYVTTVVPVENTEEAMRLETGWVGGSGEEADDEVEWSWQVLCLSIQDGHVIWSREAHRGVPRTKRHIKATHANPTPATDGRHVVAFFGSEGLYCYDMEGRPLWQKDFGKLHVGPYDAPKLEWGAASSPVIYGKHIVVQCDALNAKFISILDVETGEEFRRIPRNDVATWSTPLVFDVDGRTQIACNGYKQMASYDLLSGETVWTLEGGGDVPVPTPLVAHGLVYLTNGHGRSPVYAVDIHAKGDLTPDDENDPEGIVWWKPKGGCYMPTPIVFGENIYLCSDRGIVLAANAITGETIYRERIGSGKNSFSASVVGADGRFYWVDEGGEVYVFRAGDTFELIGANSMGEPCLATPAISDDALLIRTVSSLICLADSP